MNKIWSWPAFVVVVCSVSSALAGAELEINGAVATENYLGVGDGKHRGEFFDFRNANLVELKLKASLSDEVGAFANLQLRNTNFTNVQTADELWDRGTVDPISWRINEAYVDLYGFLLESEDLSLDLRVGKQNIAWGEADGFNPTNSFDPYNLENPLDFKERLANVAFKMSLNVGEELFVVEGVLAPRFLPSLLPVELFVGDNMLDNPLMPRVDPVLLKTLEDLGMDLVPPTFSEVRTVTPAAEVANLMSGGRLKWAMLGFDWSVSYFHGRDSLPAPRRATGVFASTVEEGCLAPGRNCVVVTDVELIYPKLDVVGMDFRGGLGGIGVWGEAGMFFPGRVDVTFSVPGLPESVIPGIDDQPYTKWTLGAEYTFKAGYYMNLQWVHGFFVERTGHALHDYLFLVFRKSLLSHRLKFELTLGGELDTTRNRRAVGGLGSLQASYKPRDGAEISLGYVMARGEPGVTFELFEPLDQVFLKIRVDF